jgi:GNAT superfamily N-acetyltransferase
VSGAADTGSVVRRAGRRAGLRLFRFYARAVASDKAGLASAGLEVRALQAEAVLPLCPEDDLNLRPEMATAAFARGDVCVAAFVGGSLAGYCWLSSVSLPHLDGVWVEFAPEVAWVYKSFVRPPYRGRGIAAALYGFTDREAHHRGRTLSVICVETHNTPSVAAALRAGYRGVGSAGYLHRGRLLVDWYSSWARSRGIAFHVPKPARFRASMV